MAQIESHLVLALAAHFGLARLLLCGVHVVAIAPRVRSNRSTALQGLLERQRDLNPHNAAGVARRPQGHIGKAHGSTLLQYFSTICHPM